MHLPTLKRRLALAKKKGPEAVLEEVQHAYEQFEYDYWPDCWHVWARAKDDAEFELRPVDWGAFINS